MIPLKLVVLGGTGFVGRHLLARLAADGHEVTLLSRNLASHALRLLPPASDIEHITATDIAISVRPRSGEATFYAHDGELTRRPAVGEDGRYTLTCRIVPKALRLYAPAPSRQEDVLESTTR